MFKEDDHDFKVMFQMLAELEHVRDKEEHHPEPNVLSHSMQAFFRASKESIDIDLILAALMHDVGKVVISKGHEKVSAELIKPHVSEKTRWLVENHMRIWTFISGEMKKHRKVTFLANHPWLPELIHLGRIDKMSRKPHKVNLNKNSIIDKLNDVVNNRYEGFEQNIMEVV